MNESRRKTFESLPHPHVISISSRTDRREAFFAMANSRGIDSIEAFEAIEGEKIPRLPQWARANPGAFGCLHSHVNLFRKAIDSNWDAITIFEDDAKILVGEASILYELNRRVEGTDYFDLYPPTGWCLGSFGYVIFRPFMKCIVQIVSQQEFPQGKWCHIDQIIRELTDFHGWIRSHSRIACVSHDARSSAESNVQWSHPVRSIMNPPSDFAEAIERDWNGVKNSKLLVLVRSNIRNQARRECIRSTWAKNLDEFVQIRFEVALGLQTTFEDDLITIGQDGEVKDFPSLKGKCKRVLDEFDFEYVFLCQDDSYVNLPCLRRLLCEPSHLTGDLFLLRKDGYARLASGLLVSRLGMETIFRRNSFTGNAPEDYLISKILMEERLQVATSCLLGLERPPAQANDQLFATVHSCNDDEMMAIYSRLHSEPFAVLRATHLQWEDDLRFYTTGYFCRYSTSCMGKWVFADNSITLDWFDWPSERIGPILANEERQLFSNAAGILN